MFTVSISVNGEPILTRSAKNHKETNEKNQTKYITDAGDTIWHDPKNGAVELAHLMLGSIKTEHLSKNTEEEKKRRLHRLAKWVIEKES